MIKEAIKEGSKVAVKYQESVKPSMASLKIGTREERELFLAESKERIRVAREKDAEKVRGIFRFHEVPGGSMDFMYKAYRGEPLAKYSMKDGEVYTIPLGVAKHLNTNCWYPSYNYKSDELGRPQVTVAEKVRRCSFQSLEFIDLESKVPTKYNFENSALPSN